MRLKICFLLLLCLSVSTSEEVTCANDGLEYNSQCYCSSRYIGSDNGNTSCTDYECLNYGVPSDNTCHCAPGFLGFHCEPVRCVPQQLQTFGKPQSLSLYVGWNSALKSSFDYINGTIIEFAKNNPDVAVNIKINDRNPTSCTTQKCVEDAFASLNAVEKTSIIPVNRLRQLVDISEFQSHVIIWTAVPLDDGNATEMNDLLQVAIAKRVKISVYAYRPDKSCVKEGAYLCQDFASLRRVANATLGTFLAPYQPLPIAKPFVVNQTLSSLSSTIINSQFFHTVLNSEAMNRPTILTFYPQELTVQIAVTSLDTDPKSVIEFDSGTVSVVANAGRWMLFDVNSLGGSLFLKFKKSFPFYYEIWAIKSEKSLSVGFTSNLEADVTSTVPFFNSDSQSHTLQNQMVMLYDGEEPKAVNTTLSNTVASLQNTIPYGTRPCQYNYLLSHAVDCSQEGEFHMMVTLDSTSVYSEVIPLYCSNPMNGKYFGSFSEEMFEFDDDEFLAEFDKASTTGQPDAATTTAQSEDTTTTAQPSESTTTAQPEACPDTTSNRTFALVLANDFTMVQSMFNVSDSSSLMQPLLEHLHNVPYSTFTIGFLDSMKKCTLKTVHSITGFKNNLLNTIVNENSAGTTTTEWDFADCIHQVLQNEFVQDYSDLFVFTPKGVGKRSGYNDAVKALYKKKITVTVVSQASADCDSPAEDDMAIMTLSTLSNGFAICPQNLNDAAVFLSNYHKVWNKPSVIINTAAGAAGQDYETRDFHVAEKAQFIFMTSCAPGCFIMVDGANIGQPIRANVMAFFYLTLDQGTHSISIVLSPQNFMYKLSMVGGDIGDLYFDFQSQTTSSYLSYGMGEYPLLGGNLAEQAENITLDVTTNDGVITANVAFEANNETACFTQKAQSNFICNKDYQIYYLHIEGSTTRTYPFACLPSSDTVCVNGDKESGQCACYPGWKGDQCAEPEDCLNGGKLVGTACQCPPHFAGIECEKFTGTCSKSEVAETLRYDSQFDSVAVVIEEDQYSTTVAYLKNLAIGFARQYTIVRFTCDGPQNCSVCSPVAMTNRQEKFAELFTNADPCTPNVGGDPLEVALETQISARGIVFFVGSNKTLAEYVPTDESLTLAAKRRAEIRFVSVGKPQENLNLSSISLSPVVTYDKTYFELYANAILPTNSSVQEAMYVVLQGNKAQKITVDKTTTYFVTFSEQLTTPLTGASNNVANQIFIFTGQTSIDLPDKTPYIVEAFGPEKVAFGLNRHIDDETREFGAIAGNGSTSYLSFYSLNWAKDGTSTPTVYYGTKETTGLIATQKNSVSSCHYTWTAQITCNEPGVLPVKISYAGLTRTVAVFCLPEYQELCSSKHTEEVDNGTCTCKDNYGDIDCSRPSCVGGILDGTVCNCPLGEDCSPQNLASTTTTIKTPTTPTTPTTTIRPKSCVNNVNVMLFLYYDAAGSEADMKNYKDFLQLLVSDFHFSESNSLVALYDMTRGRPGPHVLVCSFGADIESKINGISASGPPEDTLDADLNVLNLFTKATIGKGCGSKTLTGIPTYIVYVTSNDGSSIYLNAGKSDKQLEAMDANKYNPIIVPFNMGNEWNNMKEQDYLYPVHNNASAVVDKIWTKICRDTNEITAPATAEPPA
uniref:EGF-like domain-containing protein n=1 Tax=Steinernema glaseri TaxID=37863 RepID=A0A1I8A0H0_9BILA